MQEQHKQILRFSCYHAGGVAVATILLLGVMGGGFIAGLLALPLVVIGMGGLAVAHEMERRRALVAPAATTGAAPWKEVAKEPEVPVIATVAEAKGVCPLGYRFYRGQSWSVDGEISGLGDICPTAAEKLMEAATNLRQAPPGEVDVAICQTKVHRVVIQLRCQPVESNQPQELL